jgi:hypothetical protein
MPMHLWCQLLPQVERQLLLLRQSQVNPGMSAYSHVYHGQHNYSKHQFVPIGMESLVHVKPHKQRTYAQHCKKGFVIGTSFKHYRCQQIWMKDTHGTLILGAVWFKHKYLTNPSVTPEDQMIAAIGGLAKTLRTNIPPKLHDDTVDKLQKLQDILQPRPDGKIKSTPLKTPAQVPRVHTPYKYAPDHSPVQTPNATAPRVAMNYAIPPRVAPVETNGDATEFVYPKRDIWNEQKTRPVKPISPQQSPRIEALQKQVRVADAGQLCTVSTPAQNTRSKTAGDWPTGKGRCKVRTIKQELVLACIETYMEVMQKPVQASSLAQRKFPRKILNAVLNKDTGELMEMRELLHNLKYSNLWGKSYTKELRHLAQGIPGTKGTDTIVFIKYDEIPLDQRQNITYGKTVVTYWPEKDNPNRMRLTVGGNQIVCPFNVSTPMVEMMTVKMHLNSVISTKGAHYCTT